MKPGRLENGLALKDTITPLLLYYDSKINTEMLTAKYTVALHI